MSAGSPGRSPRRSDDLEAARAGAALLGDRVVLEYDWDAATDATEAVYERVLSRPGGSRRVR